MHVWDILVYGAAFGVSFLIFSLPFAAGLAIIRGALKAGEKKEAPRA